MEAWEKGDQIPNTRLCSQKDSQIMDFVFLVAYSVLPPTPGKIFNGAK